MSNSGYDHDLSLLVLRHKQSLQLQCDGPDDMLQRVGIASAVNGKLPQGLDAK